MTMKMISIMPKVMMGIFTCAGAGLFADDIAVGKWARLTIDDNTPALSASEGLYLCEKAASVSYAGTDTWTLPLGSVFAFGSTEIAVRNGTLRLENSEAPDLVANPPEELQKAAIWLDAGKNVQTEVINSHTCVLKWFDARESSTAASGFGYAAASDIAGAGPIWGENYVSFRGYDSSLKRSFLYKTADGNVTNYNVRHAFFVQRTNSDAGRTAPVLGNTSSANFFAASSGSYNPMLSYQGNANPLAYTCEYLLDGVYGDPTAALAVGTHLHEFTLPPNRTISVDSLMRDRSVASGGHNIHEILLFTQPLTHRERMRITAYLKAKWSCGGESSLVVRALQGAAVELADGMSPNSVEITGEGALTVGSGATCEVLHLYADSRKERVPYALKDNTSKLYIEAAEYEYLLSPQDRLSVDSQDKQSILTKDSGDSKGSASVVSERQFIVSSLDSGITNLSVSGGGDLVFRAKYSEDMGYQQGIESTATFAMTSLSVPPGKTGVETTVDVPVSGDWEIEFNISNSFSDSATDAAIAFYEVQLKNGDSVIWSKRPTAVAPLAYGNVNQVRRYLLRNLSAGTYTFRGSGVANTAIEAAIYDLSMTFVPNLTHETVVPVTDGDFESSRFSSVFYASSKNNTGSRTGWVLTNGDLKAESNPAYQTIVASSMGYSGDYNFMFRSSQLGRYGDNALVWYHNNSTATSPQTTLPAGRWKLRLDAVRWMTGTTSHSKVGTGDAGRCNNPATLAASVTVNDGEPVSLGEIGPISNFTAAQLTFPASFDVSEGDSVKVILDQTTANAAVQIDNLEFVKGESPASPSLGDELVVGGNVETADDISAWTLDDYTPAGGVRHVVQVRSPVDTAFGSTRCDGTNVFRNANGGRAYQTISFPAGVFKLSWWSRARVQNGGVIYSSPVTFWYAADGAESTNVIVRSENSWCTNFLEHVAYFSVPTAGNYVFGFNSDDMRGTDVLVDCVSVKQVLLPDVTPEVSEYAKIEVSGGGMLRLDFTGCLNLAKVKINGSALSGEISAAKYPRLVCGPGTVYVKPKGFVLICR